MNDEKTTWVDTLLKLMPLLTLVIAFLWYWVKRYYDLQTKKNEIKFEHFFKSKMNAIELFFVASNNFERGFNNIARKTIGDKCTYEEYEEQVERLRLDFEIAFSHVKIYIKEPYIDNFNEVKIALDNLWVEFQGYVSGFDLPKKNKYDKLGELFEQNTFVVQANLLKISQDIESLKL